MNRPPLLSVPSRAEMVNSETVDWLWHNTQRLLDEEHRRAESLQARGGQIAVFAGAVFALVSGFIPGGFQEVSSTVAIIGAVLFVLAALALLATVLVAIVGIVHPQGRVALGPREVSNYTTDRFTEAERWKIQKRTIRALEKSFRETRAINLRKAAALQRAGSLFLLGLSLSVAAAATLALGIAL